MLRGAELGDPRIVVHDVEAHHAGRRLAGAPHDDPFRLRVVQPGDVRPQRDSERRRSTICAQHIRQDLAADIGALLASGATFDGRPLQAGDVAVIVESHKDARACHRALATPASRRCTPATPTSSVPRPPRTGCALLEAFDQPHRPGVVRAAAATMFFGETAEDLATGGDELTDRHRGDAAGVGGPRA